MSTPDHDAPTSATPSDRSTMSTPDPSPAPGPTPEPSADLTTGPTTDPSTVATTAAVTPRRLHPFNTFFGLLFLAVAGSWLARDQGLLDGVDVGRLVAVGLIVLGALGLLATVLVGRRGRRGRTTAPGPLTDDV